MRIYKLAEEKIDVGLTERVFGEIYDSLEGMKGDLHKIDVEGEKEYGHYSEPDLNSMRELIAAFENPIKIRKRYVLKNLSKNTVKLLREYMGYAKDRLEEWDKSLSNAVSSQMPKDPDQPPPPPKPIAQPLPLPVEDDANEDLEINYDKQWKWYICGMSSGEVYGKYPSQELAEQARKQIIEMRK